MHRVVVVDHDTIAETLYDGPDVRRASLTYTKAVLRRRTAHLQWLIGTPLPGLPEQVNAERFGNPCDEPCCVPLAQAWPEQDPTVTTCDTGSIERERKRDA